MAASSTKLSTADSIVVFALKPHVSPFLNLPYDIFDEITRYLTPKDLLSVYRVGRALRDHLQSPVGRRQWRHARQNEPGLPPCPPWLSEPQFAALCFDDHCQKCLKPNLKGSGTIWVFNARYCTTCIPTQVTSRNPFEDFPTGAYLEDFLAKPHLCVPCTPRRVPLGYRHRVRDYFHIPHINRLRAAIVATSNGDGGPTELNKRRSNVLCQWEAQMREYGKHSQQCLVWQRDRDARIRMEILLAKRQRQEAILSRVRDLGYSRDIPFLGRHFQALGEPPVAAIFDKVDPLTNDEWSIIAPTVIAFFEERRVLREWYWHRVIITLRLGHLTKALNEYREANPGEFLPHTVDICMDATLIPTLSLPPMVTLPYPIFSELLPGWLRNWRQRREHELISKLAEDDPSLWNPSALSSHACDPSGRILTRSSDRTGSPPLSIFGRFFCTKCKVVISHTAAMTHACCYLLNEDWRETAYFSPDADGKFPRITCDVFKSACSREFEGVYGWSLSCLRPCSALIRDILVALGVDVRSQHLGVGQIDGMHLACASCSKDNALLVMGWHRAIIHAFESHPSAELRWASVPPAVAYKAQRVECARYRLTAEEVAQGAVYECLHCAIPHSMEKLRQQRMLLHLRWGHFITNPQYGQDYQEASDGAGFLHPAVLVAASELRGGDLDMVVQGGERYRQERRVGFLSLRHFASAL